MADLAADSDLHVIGVLSQAAGYLSLLPALRYELRMRSIRMTKSWERWGKGGAEEE